MNSSNSHDSSYMGSNSFNSNITSSIRYGITRIITSNNNNNKNIDRWPPTQLFGIISISYINGSTIITSSCLVFAITVMISRLQVVYEI